MSLTLDQIVARLEDPEVPVVWLDPITPDILWNDLPDALAKRGLAVLNLDGAQPITDHDSLLERFAQVAPSGPLFKSLTSLKDRLLDLPHEAARGWVVMFRYPELLRQNDEETFEDFLETLELVHESQYEMHNRIFKLVVRD
jgi:hypothetical protein